MTCCGPKPVLYCGFDRETEVTVSVVRITPEIAETGCLECGGSGRWGYGPTDAECGPCVACKGTGRVLINV